MLVGGIMVDREKVNFFRVGSRILGREKFTCLMMAYVFKYRKMSATLVISLKLNSQQQCYLNCLLRQIRCKTHPVCSSFVQQNCSF